MQRLLVVVTLAACQAAQAPSLPAGDGRELATERRLLAARDTGDVATMRAHAWSVWQRLQDRWETWPRSDVVFGDPDRVFRALQPIRVRGRMEPETLPLMFAVMFDPVAAAHVQRHHLASRAALSAHPVPAFPRSAITLKAVWYPVHHDRITTIPIWDDQPAFPDGNPTRSWSRRIAIVPDPRARELLEIDHNASDEADARPAQHVPLSAFLHRALASGAEVAAARAVAHDPTLAAGDYVVVVAMHVATKQIPDWVWATFWWHDRATDGPFGANRPDSITGAAANYRMAVAYSADGSVAMNPWLEARFPGGLHSNCVACHQRAALGAVDYLPVTRGATPAEDPYFAGKVATDFVWSLALEAR